jgi:CHAT domain-containing protein
VDDVSTALLMEQFYAHLLSGQTAASALRQAQLDLCSLGGVSRAKGERPYDHPFYWAPFCLLGAPNVRLIGDGP